MSRILCAKRDKRSSDVWPITLEIFMIKEGRKRVKYGEVNDGCAKLGAVERCQWREDKIGGSIESSVMEGKTGAMLKEVSDGMVKQGAI